MKKKIFVITFILLALSALLLYIRIERKPQTNQKSTVSSIHASQSEKSSSSKKDTESSNAAKEKIKPTAKSLVGKTFFNDANKIEFISSSQYIISVARSEGDGDMQVAFKYSIDGNKIEITNPSGQKETDNFSFSEHKVTIGEATYTDQPNSKYWDKNGKDISKAPKKNYNDPNFEDEENSSSTQGKTQKKSDKKSTVKSKKKNESSASDSTDSGKEEQKNESKSTSD